MSLLALKLPKRTQKNCKRTSKLKPWTYCRLIVIYVKILSVLQWLTITITPLCEKIELESNADQSRIAAQIQFEVERYLASPVLNYMQAFLMLQE